MDVTVHTSVHRQSGYIWTRDTKSELHLKLQVGDKDKNNVKGIAALSPTLAHHHPPSPTSGAQIYLCKMISVSLLIHLKMFRKLQDRNINTSLWPQGYVLSQTLFSLFTNDFRSTSDSFRILKYADDTTIVGLISKGNEDT